MSNNRSQSSELYTTLLNVGLLNISLGFFFTGLQTRVPNLPRKPLFKPTW